MRVCLVICILFFVGIEAEDCDIQFNDDIKTSYVDYLKNADSWDLQTFKKELKKLNNKIVEYEKTVDPKCFEGTYGHRAKSFIDRYVNKFDFLSTINEHQKQVIYAPENMKCFIYNWEHIKYCVDNDDEDVIMKLCE